MTFQSPLTPEGKMEGVAFKTKLKHLYMCQNYAKFNISLRADLMSLDKRKIYFKDLVRKRKKIMLLVRSDAGDRRIWVDLNAQDYFDERLEVPV